MISSCQSAFVLGRQLLDGVLMVDEVVDYAYKGLKSCLFFKVDFEKSYDKISWKFLDYMFRRMEFGEV